MSTPMPAEAADALRQEILDELRWNSRVDGCRLDVQVDGPVVALRGTAPSLAAARAAVEVTREVPGVHAVVDDVDVVAPAPHACDDVDLAKRAWSAIERDARLPAAALEVSVRDGVVSVGGRVPSWAVHDDVVRCLIGVSGARGLATSLVVRPTGGPDADELRSAIGRALARRAPQAAKHVDVSVSGDVVTLRGHAASSAEREAVVRAVKGTRGVAMIQDDIEVVRGAS